MGILVRANTGVMSAQEEKYWLHMLSGDPMLRDFINRQSMHGVDPMDELMKRPICPKCERPCFHHGKGIACNHCGFTGPQTHKVKIHLKEAHYR